MFAREDLAAPKVRLGQPLGGAVGDVPVDHVLVERQRLLQVAGGKQDHGERCRRARARFGHAVGLCGAVRRDQADDRQVIATLVVLHLTERDQKAGVAGRSLRLLCTCILDANERALEPVFVELVLRVGRQQVEVDRIRGAGREREALQRRAARVRVEVEEAVGLRFDRVHGGETLGIHPLVPEELVAQRLRSGDRLAGVPDHERRERLDSRIGNREAGGVGATGQQHRQSDQRGQRP